MPETASSQGAEDQFVLFSQPIVELRTRRVSYHELLLRLVKSDSRVLSPGAFSSAIREHGMESQLDLWVAEQAIAMLEPASERPGPQLEINVSRTSAVGPELPRLLNQELPQRGISPDALIVEVAQGENVDPNQMRQLGQRAFSLAYQFDAVDSERDAFAKLQNLPQLPYDYVKIDGGFIRDLAENAADQAIVRKVARIASSFNRRTVAMHVEDAASMEILREAGVDYGQGFFLGKPEPLAPA